MKKVFNITGACVPEKHFMVDISQKKTDIFAMIEPGDYFVINRPRQYGKTTLIDLLERMLKTTADYFPIKISFEDIGDEGFMNASVFIKVFLLMLKQEFILAGNTDLVAFLETGAALERMDEFGVWLSELVLKIGKKTVLMIDEVDKNCDNQLFLNFLGMLRKKYLARNAQGVPTFHSVILVGVHDVKNLKIKIRPDAEAKYNSPWNIAVDFKVDLTFSPKEIIPMLEDYASERHVKMDPHAIAEKIGYYTSGYPFLVSKLCKTIDEEIVFHREVKEIYLDDIERATQWVLKEDNTNFESLIKNLENNQDLYDLVFKLVMNEVEFSFNRHNSIIARGILYGVFKEDKGKTRIQNRIYEQLIYNYITSNLETSGAINLSKYNTGASYLNKEGELDMEKVRQL